MCSAPGTEHREWTDVSVRDGVVAFAGARGGSAFATAVRGMAVHICDEAGPTAADIAARCALAMQSAGDAVVSAAAT